MTGGPNDKMVLAVLVLGTIAFVWWVWGGCKCESEGLKGTYGDASRDHAGYYKDVPVYTAKYNGVPVRYIYKMGSRIPIDARLMGLPEWEKHVKNTQIENVFMSMEGGGQARYTNFEYHGSTTQVPYFVYDGRIIPIDKNIWATCRGLGGWCRTWSGGSVY